MALSNETKVGLLVVVALAGLAWLSFKSGSFGAALATPMRELHTTFSNVEGIQAGSPVRMAGVDVGSVKEVKLSPNGTAAVTVEVRKDVRLPSDVTAMITTSGLIGERYLALTPGNATMAGTNTALLPANVTTIPSGSAAQAGDIGNNFAKVSDDLQTMTNSLRQVLGSPENAQKLQTIIDGLAVFSGNLQSDSGDIITNLKEASASLKTLLGGADGKQTGQMLQNFSLVADNLAQITTRLQKGEGPIGQLLMGDAESGQGNMLADLQSASREFKELMAKVNRGEGTIGKLVNDPATADKLNNALDTLTAASDRLEQFRTELAFEGRSLVGEDSVSKGELSLMLQPRPTRFYLAGITSDGFATKSRDDSNPTNPYYGAEFGKEAKFTLQFGQVYQNALLGQDVDLRLGLKDSTGGIGADTYGVLPYVNKNYKLSADLYDFGGKNSNGVSNPHLDLTGRVDIIGKTVYGVAGYDNILNQQYSSPVVGVGMRFQDDDLKYILGRAL